MGSLFESSSWSAKSFYSKMPQKEPTELVQSSDLEISIEIPEDTPPEKIRDLVKQAALQADSIYRANGGQGLKIDTVDVFSDIDLQKSIRGFSDTTSSLNIVTSS